MTGMIESTAASRTLMLIVNLCSDEDDEDEETGGDEDGVALRRAAVLLPGLLPPLLLLLLLPLLVAGDRSTVTATRATSASGRLSLCITHSKMSSTLRTSHSMTSHANDTIEYQDYRSKVRVDN
jgi:hypothetical protein